MKNKFLIAILAIFMLPFSACDNDALLELNIDPNSSTELDFDFILANVQGGMTTNGYVQSRTNIIYSSTMVQQLASTAGFVSGDKYFWNEQYTSALFQSYYPGLIRNVTHMVDNLKDTEEVNVYAMALVVRTQALQKITDIYGDVPYSEAGRGLEGQDFWFPKYDDQEEIYGFMVRDLREARDIMNASAPSPGTQDIYFGGDIEKWKRYINSLLLRIGMRLTKVDAGLAQSIVEEAANHPSGTFQSTADNVVVVHNDAATNGNSAVIISDAYRKQNSRISSTFIDWMQATNDPRLMIVSGGVGDPDDPSTWDLDPANQVGMPNGYDAETIKEYEGTTAEVNRDLTYSRMNPLLLDVDDPFIFMTYAEVEFLLAEAALKGWHSGDAAAHFNAGVKGSMQQWDIFDPSLTVSDEEVDAYLAANPFDGTEEMIGEQHWAANFMQWYEAYSNWRRTGYPELTPVNYPGNVSGGQIFRRIEYYTQEVANNPNLQEGGTLPDNVMTRVWWDVE